jgi:hypothetical protein
MGKLVKHSRMQVKRNGAAVAKADRSGPTRQQAERVGADEVKRKLPRLFRVPVGGGTTWQYAAGHSCLQRATSQHNNALALTTGSLQKIVSIKSCSSGCLKILTGTS